MSSQRKLTPLFHKIIPQVVRSMSGFVMVYRTSTSNCKSSLLREKITSVSQPSHKKSSKQFFLLLLFTTVVLADSYLKPIQFLQCYLERSCFHLSFCKRKIFKWLFSSTDSLEKISKVLSRLVVLILQRTSQKFHRGQPKEGNVSC